VSEERERDPAAVPTAPPWIIGVIQLVAGAVVLGIGRLVGPHSRAPLFWGLLLCSVALTPLLGAYRTFRARESVALEGELPEGSSIPGLVVVSLPVALSLAFLLTDPAPWHESLYLVALVVAAWIVLSLLWGSRRIRRAADTGEPAPRMPGLVRLFWPMVPGATFLLFALTAPGSSSRSCQDGGTCYEGPISLTLPGFLLLVAGVVGGVFAAKGSSIDRRIRVKLPGTAPKGLDARIDRLAELGRLRKQGVIDDAEFDRLKAEVVGPGAASE
jgi:hypothetical protein